MMVTARQKQNYNTFLADSRWYKTKLKLLGGGSVCGKDNTILNPKLIKTANDSALDIKYSPSINKPKNTKPI